MMHYSSWLIQNPPFLIFQGASMNPPVGGFFELLDGTNFLLLNGTNFLLL